MALDEASGVAVAIRSALLGLALLIAVAGCAGSVTLGSTTEPVEPSPTVPSSSSPSADPEALVADAVVILDDLFAGRYGDVRARFNVAMLAALSEDQLRSTIAEVLESAGDLVAVGDPGSVEHDGHLVVFVPVSTERALLHLRATYEPSGQLAGLFLLS